MNKGLLGGAWGVIVLLAVVALVRHRHPVDHFSYDLHGATSLVIHSEAQASDLPLTKGRADKLPPTEDIERLWPLAKEWVAAHQAGGRIMHIGLRHMEVSAQSKSATVFVAVTTESGSFVYELKYEWRQGWKVTDWSVAPQDHAGARKAAGGIALPSAYLCGTIRLSPA